MKEKGRKSGKWERPNLPVDDTMFVKVDKGG